MDDFIKNIFETARASIDTNMDALCRNRIKIEDWDSKQNNPEIIKAGGIYSFWDAGKAVYVGRAKNDELRKKYNISYQGNQAKNILSRFKQHLKFEKNQSPLALKLAKESLAKEKGGEEGREYLLPHYGNSEKEREIRNEIEKCLKDDKIRKRINAMEFSFFKEESTLRQYFSEMSCSVKLNTTVLDKKGEEEDNIEKVDETGKIYYRYSFYNSFKTS